jgi:hypothetical protein
LGEVVRLFNGVPLCAHPNLRKQPFHFANRGSSYKRGLCKRTLTIPVSLILTLQLDCQPRISISKRDLYQLNQQLRYHFNLYPILKQLSTRFSTRSW